MKCTCFACQLVEVDFIAITGFPEGLCHSLRIVLCIPCPSLQVHRLGTKVRNDFNFEVVNYPNLSGNIPTSQSYAVFVSQLVRFCSINTSLKNFVLDVQHMVYTLKKQNFQHEVLKSRFLRFAYKYMYSWAKYNKDLVCKMFVSTIF